MQDSGDCGEAGKVDTAGIQKIVEIEVDLRTVTAVRIDKVVDTMVAIRTGATVRTVKAVGIVKIVDIVVAMRTVTEAAAGTENS